MTTCPYCEQPVSTVIGRDDCPHCGAAIFNVACPRCSRRTLNLTLIPRYGKAVCFTCSTEMAELPPISPAEGLIALSSMPQRANGTGMRSAQTGVREPPGRSTAVRPSLTLTPRAPRIPSMPTAAEARKIIEGCLVGLERAAQDREVLQTPELRAVITIYLEAVQDLLALDDFMNQEKVTPSWLRGTESTAATQSGQAHAIEAPLDSITRLCFRPLCPAESVLLPQLVQAWVLAIDDTARHWQYARRCWLAESCGLTIIPIVPGLTTVNPDLHAVSGHGHLVKEVLTPGFLLGDEVLRKARVRA